MRPRLKNLLFVLFAGFTLSLATGCGDSALTAATETVSETGGTVALSGSGTQIVFPANALTQATEITLSPTDANQLAPLNNAAVAFTIEPAGTQLAVPATFTIDVVIPADSTAKAYRFADGTWVPVEGTEVVGNRVQLSLSSLVPIAIALEPQGGGNRIEGTAVWGSGSPADNTPIELWQFGYLISSTTTDAEGRFSFVDLSEGAYTVKLPPLAECPAEESVNVTADAPVSVNLVICGASSTGD